MTTDEQPRQLIFQWPARHVVLLALPIMLLLSALLHAGAFLLFGIAYPRQSSRMMNPAEVYFLIPGSAQDARILPLVSASNPALFAPGYAQPNNQGSEYATSFDEGLPEIAKIPPVAKTPAAPSLSSGPVPLARRLTPAVAPAPALATAIQGRGSLKGRIISTEPARQFTAPTGLNLESTSFLAAIRADGSTAHVIPEEGSGSPELDKQALRHLLGTKFTPAPEGSEEVWGEIFFQWGADVRRTPSP